MNAVLVAAPSKGSYVVLLGESRSMNGFITQWGSIEFVPRRLAARGTPTSRYYSGFVIQYEVSVRISTTSTSAYF